MELLFKLDRTLSRPEHTVIQKGLEHWKTIRKIVKLYDRSFFPIMRTLFVLSFFKRLQVIYPSTESEAEASPYTHFIGAV